MIKAMAGGIGRERLVSVLVLLAAVAGIGGIAVLLGADGNYDLRNYHFYVGYALFNKPVGYDLAPAQIQSYLHPALDGLLYKLWRALNPAPRLLTFVWAVPQAVAVWLAYGIARETIPSGTPARLALCLLATLIGGLGAASLGVVGTSMSEAIPDALLLGAVLLALHDLRLGPAAWRLALAGALAGVAVGLKLTTASYAVACGAGLLLAPGIGAPGVRARRVLAFGLGGVVALLAVGGPWWWALYKVFGNPLFPFYNAVFRSPDYGPFNWFDDRFFPRSVLQWVFYPLWWAFTPSTLVSEEPIRDGRIALGLLAALGILAGRVVAGPGRRPSAAACWCAIWFLVAYVLWLQLFSIVRYAAGLELLSGVVIVAGIGAALPARLFTVRVAAASLAAGLLIGGTVLPIWERRPNPGERFLSVQMPQLPADSLVLMLVATPASYLAASQPATVRFVGLNNSLLRLDSTFGLQGRVERAIAGQAGPIWGIEKTDAFAGEADQSLRRYRLHRTEDCRAILSNQDTHLQVCRLARD